jgi:uncharacterized protein YoxC
MRVLWRLGTWTRNRKGLGWTLLFLTLASLYGGVAPYLIAEGLPAERVVLNVATALELIGLFTIAKGVAKLQRHFDEPDWWSNWKKAWVELVKVFKKPEPVTLEGSSALGHAHVIGDATVIAGRPEELEARVKRLEDDVDQLQEDLRGMRSDLEDDIQAVENDIEALQNHLDEEIQQVHEQRQQAALGGLEVEGAGLTCLILGLLLSAQTDAVVALFRFIG